MQDIAEPVETLALSARQTQPNVPAECPDALVVRDLSLHAEHSCPSRFYEPTKRILDLSIGTVALILSTPLWLLAAVMIKSASREGPVVFRQTRLGRGGKPFTCLKFRTMVLDAELRQAELNHLNESDGPAFKIRNDPRIIRFGNWLRHTSIDELPQLLNVLKGDMSLVGPRPAVPSEVESYTPQQLKRLSVKPGMTCIWQVSGRSNNCFETWMQMDLDYIDNRSILTDLRLLFRTAPAVISGEGAW